MQQLISDNVLIISVVLLIALVLSAVLLFSRSSSGRSRRAVQNTVVLAGPSGSGKTALFYRLTTNKFRETVSSLKPNKAPFLASSVSSNLIDYPGHGRLRSGLFPILHQARCIVFVIDPTDKQQVKDGAERLYDILADEKVMSPIIIAASKSDKENQKSLKWLAAELEKEIDRMRKSRDGEDGRVLGTEGIAFTFKDAPIPLKIVGCSSKDEGKTDDLVDLLARMI